MVLLQAGVGRAGRGLRGLVPEGLGQWAKNRGGRTRRRARARPSLDRVPAGRWSRAGAGVGHGPARLQGAFADRAQAGLARDADAFATITEAEAAAVLPDLTAQGHGDDAESGAAGLAALRRDGTWGRETRVLAFVTEEAAAMSERLRGGSEYRARVAARAGRRMARCAGLGALLLTTEAEIRYFSGFLTRFWESPEPAVVPGGAGIGRRRWR